MTQDVPQAARTRRYDLAIELRNHPAWPSDRRATALTPASQPAPSSALVLRQDPFLIFCRVKAYIKTLRRTRTEHATTLKEGLLSIHRLDEADRAKLERRAKHRLDQSIFTNCDTESHGSLRCCHRPHLYCSTDSSVLRFRLTIPRQNKEHVCL